MRKMALFRKRILISLIVIVPLGFASKFYSGPAAWWFNDYLGGVFYEIFWCLVAVLIQPKLPAASIALSVFLITSGLEFLQLWHPIFLEMIRSHFLGKTLIGTSFAWNDFPYYILGCVIGWVWVVFLKRISFNVRSEETACR